MRKTNSGRSANRREFLKGSALATGVFFINSKFSLKMLDDEPTSPFTVPWLQPLRFPNYAIPLPEWQPLDPIIDPAAHQRFEEFAPTYFYEYEIREAQHRAHPQLGFSTLSTFCDSYPAPTFMMRYGQPAFVRMKNHLPATVQGFGHCDVITHVHNGHHPSESDGYPGDHFSPGMFRDYHYPNIYAGGDPLEAKSTLWYHDHCLDFTSQNVYRGLAGFFLLFDDKDSGNENDPNPDALRLPSGVPDGKRVKHRYDIPLILFDPRFDSQGKQIMNIMDMDGHLGDKYTVNGLVQPYFEVERRKYRFRILDGGPSRFYELWFSNGMEFQHIGNDGNLLPAPVTANHVKLAVAERADIVVDFSTLPSTTTEIFLVNRAEQIDGRGPTGNLLPMATAPKLLKLIIRPKSGAVPDQSQVPSVLKPNPAMDLPVVATRSWHFDRTNGMWAINGKLADLSAPSAVVKQNTAEIWHLSTSGGWAHPVHMHMEEYRILTRNGQSVAGTVLGGRKDVFPLYAGDEMTIYMKFRDWIGRYVMHCHNTVHEDHSMMLRWDVVP